MFVSLCASAQTGSFGIGASDGRLIEYPTVVCARILAESPRAIRALRREVNRWLTVSRSLKKSLALGYQGRVITFVDVYVTDKAAGRISVSHR